MHSNELTCTQEKQCPKEPLGGKCGALTDLILPLEQQSQAFGNSIILQLWYLHESWETGITSRTYERNMASVLSTDSGGGDEGPLK